MFKPTTFRFKNTIHWPGVGPASELEASNISKVESEGDDYTFVHASGHAVKVPKSAVTAYGVYDADEVPNLPKEKDYKDDASKLDDDEKKDTRLGGHTAPLPTEPVKREKKDKKDVKKEEKIEKKEKEIAKEPKESVSPSVDSSSFFSFGKKK